MNLGPTTQITSLFHLSIFTKPVRYAASDWSNFGLPETCRELNTGNISPFLLTVSIGFYHQSWRSRSFPTWMSTRFFPKSIDSLFISQEKKIFLDHTSHYFLENVIHFWLTISLRLSTSHQLDSTSITSSIAIGLRIIQLMKYFGLWLSLYLITVTLKIGISSYECQWINLCIHSSPV